MLKKQGPVILLMVVILITALLYHGSLKGEFLSYDDTDNITGNMLIRNLSPGSLPAYFRSTSLFMYSPLTFISYGVDYKISGMDPFFYRLTNLLIHLVNVLLVYLLGFLLLKRNTYALVVAAFFALHPANADAVAWISSRSNLLATCFSLVTLVLYIHYVRRTNYIFYIFSFVAFLFALLSKSAAVMLPFTLFLIDFLESRKLNAKLILEKVPFFAAALLIGLLAIWFRTDTGATQTTVHYAVSDRFFMVCYSLLAWVVRSVVPYHLSEVYAYPVKQGAFLPFFYYLAPLLLAGIVVLLLRIKPVRKEILFGLLFFFLNSIITQAALLEDNFMANRYTYLPYIGLFLILVFAAGNLVTKYPSAGRYLGILLVALLLIFGWMTHRRSLVWSNTLALFNHAIATSPDAAFAYNNRGIARYYRGDMEGAMEDYNKAIDLNPGYSGAYYNRGIVNNHTGQYELAMSDYTRAIGLNPSYASSYAARGILQMDIYRNYFAALNDYDRAIEINPTFAQAYYNRGILRLRMNDPLNACEDFKKVKSMGYDKADALIEKYCR